jgi:hypothetical protein
MPVFEILPLEAIGPVRLGVSRATARQAMSMNGLTLEQSHGGVDYFCGSCMQLSYGPNDEVWFIGVSGNLQFTFMFKGVDVFALPAAELFSLMAASDNSGPHDFTSYEYCFPKQILTLWDADEQYDHQGGETREVWGQVGIGNHAYLAAISAIKNKI